MFVSLSQQTEKMGERMNSAMNHRRGGGLQEMITGTDPLINFVVFKKVCTFAMEMNKSKKEMMRK